MPTGVYERTDKYRERMSEAKSNQSEETRKAIGKAMIGNTNSKREKNGNWIGGFTYDTNGYIKFLVPEGCKFSCMKDNHGYVLMHRLIVAENLQRPLTKREVVHHINGDITDNRIENLRLFGNDGKHRAYHRWELKGGQYGKI